MFKPPHPPKKTKKQNPGLIVWIPRQDASRDNGVNQALKNAV